MATALDDEIIARGRDEGRMVVTIDADFHAILARDSAASPSVIRLRVQRLGGTELAELIRAVVDACRDELAEGAAVTANTVRVKLRRLPLGR
jgi:predicted nuclease of predicted toxin-antitoxin system